MQGTIITNKGLRLITKLVASQGTLTFTRAAVGTGKVPEGYDPAGMTGLSHYQMDGKISSYHASEDIAAIVFQVQSVGITQGFTITEAGIYADDPDEGEVLYAYLDMSEDPQYIYAENSAVSKFVEMTLETVIGRVEKITAVINPYHLITREGDISDTVVKTMEPSTMEFPEPSAGEKTGVILGKIKKCIADFKAMKNTLVTLSHLVNDGLTTEPGYAADARQLNPNLSGTLAAQVAALGGNLTVRYNWDTDHIQVYNGVWVDAIRAGVQKLYLFSPTDMCEDITGGWAWEQGATNGNGIYGYSSRKSYDTGVITVYQTVAQSNTGGTTAVESHAYYRTVNSIDVTLYKTLYFYASVENATGWSYYKRVEIAGKYVELSGTAKTLYSLDISSLTGAQQVAIHTRACAFYNGGTPSTVSVTIYEMWMEK